MLPRVYSPKKNEDIQAQEIALGIVAFIEQLQHLRDNLESFVGALPREHKPEGEKYVTQVTSLLVALETDDSEIADSLRNAIDLSKLGKSKITRLGLTKDILRMSIDEGMSVNAIAKELSINRSTISLFLSNYKKLSPGEKHRAHKSSVFDIAGNMEDLHAMLLRMQARALASEDLEGSSKVAGEIRQLIKLADQYLDKRTNAEKFNTLLAIIQEAVQFHCTPEGRPGLIARLKELQSGGVMSMLTTVVPAVRQIEETPPE